jgi:D-beta-D-heptose 7-phosphate kinase/D-beta-D-heptose 1-phosphate adenosyltransferase
MWSIWEQIYQKQLQPPSIWIFGDTMMDITYQGSYQKFANEAPIPVFHTQYNSSIQEPGGAYNIYENIKHLPHNQLLFFTIVGNDSYGHSIHSLFPHTSFIDSTRPTTLKQRWRVDDTLVFRHDIESIHPIDISLEEQLLESIHIHLQQHIPNVFILSDYGKGFFTKTLCKKLIEIANEYNIPTIIDPKQPLSTYTNATFLKLNKKEIYQLLPECNKDFTMEQRCQYISTHYNIPIILVTLSQDGAYLYHHPTQQFQLFPIPSIPSFQHIYAKDVVGAGDIIHVLIGYWFSIAFSSLYQQNLWNEIIPWILCVATGTVLRIGTSNIKYVPIYQYYLECYGKIQSIYSVSWGIQWMKQHISHCKIGWTNGCFDLFHMGHLYNLQEASRMCDFLIVGINTDSSVQMNKGPNRPIQSHSFRADNIAKLNEVDVIVYIEEKTPEFILKILQPDRLFKGQDYTMDQIVGKEYVKEIYLIPYESGYSTTNQIRQILDKSF